MIDARLDILVWAAVLLFLILMGARAWAVETAGSRHYRTSARVRVLTAATGLALVALVGLVGMQGGITFVQAVATRTEPRDMVTLVKPDGSIDARTDKTPPDAVGPDAPAADPNAPPADPNAPPADPNAPGPADQGAPPAPDQGAPPAVDQDAPPAAGEDPPPAGGAPAVPPGG